MALEGALHSLGSYVMFRDQDALAAVTNGGNVAVVVPRPRSAERQFVAALGKPVSVARRFEVTSLLYEWGRVDLLFGLRWRGVQYLDATAVLKHRELSPRGLFRPRPAHHALISWFSTLRSGGFIDGQCRDTIIHAVAADGDELAQVLQEAVGRRLGRRLWRRAVEGKPEESEAWARHIRRATWRRAVVRAPLRTIAEKLRFWTAEAGIRFKPPLPWMAVLGPDGSGKSTLLTGLSDSWLRSLGPVYVHHLRPHVLSRKRGVASPVVDPHGTPPRGLVMSVAVLVIVMFDWWIGYWTRIVPERAKPGLVLFDRHLLDLLVDPLRYRYGGPLWLARGACRLVPRPEVIVVLDGSPAVVRARKQEVSPAELTRQCIAYRRLAEETPDAYLVDAGMPPVQVRDATLKIYVETTD